MIYFVAEDFSVVARVLTGLYGNEGKQIRLDLRWNAQSDVCAKALALHLNSHVCDMVEHARREAYEQGWKDAKSKRRKQTHFSRVL